MSDDDLVLCERAAKAVGVKVRRGNFMGFGHLKVVDDDHGMCKADSWFCPLSDDGQAFRMAMQMLMGITTGPYGYTVHHERSRTTVNGEWSSEDINQGLRRAIVQVAAKVAP